MSDDPTQDSNWVTPDGQYLYDYDTSSWYTWDAANGTWDSSDPPSGEPTPPQLQWNTGDANHPHDHPLPSGGSSTPPPKIPGGDGKGKTSVDTPSLDLFAENMLGLATPVGGLMTKIQGMHAVQPGAFYHADAIRQAVNGDNGDAGLRMQYRKVCNDLATGLTDLHDAVKVLSAKYKTTDDANNGTADDVQKALSGVTGDFNGIPSDAGGGSGGPPSG